MSPLEGFSSPPPAGREHGADPAPGRTPAGLAGDVDRDGEIVDALTLRLRRAIGFCSADIDPERHVALVRDLLERVRS